MQYLAYNGPAPDGSGALTNVSASDFVGRYKFENMNYYSVEWSKLNMVNYWLTATTTNGCDIQQTKWGVQYCGKTMGSYEKDSAFTTGARTRSYQNVPLTSEQGSGDLVNLGGMLTECFYYGNVLVMSKGHVNEKTGLHDFGKVSIDDQYFWLVCN
mmetsp:Transcript_19775/g.35790  ORF Transcript_19775/g.35790 Transcript_19775/m.35790 type:complete len:156 (+) Transcript_19775:86-553(+)